MLILILLLLLLLFILQKKKPILQNFKNLKIKFFQKKNNSLFLENNLKTFFVLTIFLYLVTFPLYHPEKAKIKKEKIKAYELQKLNNDNFYKKKVELDPKNSVYFKNQIFISNLKDDKLFFQFPQRKKKRLELLKKLKEEKNLILLNLKNNNLTLIEKNNLINQLETIEEKIKNLERYFE